ncbi:MAG: hypothetical protein LC700_00025, partial [Actinobacteria bacterium]|nr:hypothetical protein [Actinomycetota bacterium]
MLNTYQELWHDLTVVDRRHADIRYHHLSMSAPVNRMRSMSCPTTRCTRVMISDSVEECHLFLAETSS